MTENGRIRVVGDGIKCSKSGRRMPAVKRLHQSSDSNTKAEFIMGHSLQASGLLCKVGQYAFCVPIIARIHEGIVLCNADERTQIDRMILMAMGLLGDGIEANVILDARYCSGESAKGLVAQSHHLIVRCKKKTVGYLPPEPEAGPQRRGRPRKYGAKERAIDYLLTMPAIAMQRCLHAESAPSAVYRSAELLWRPTGKKALFVLVDHPKKGRILLMTTDLETNPESVAELYSYRFKIEVSFKQSICTPGAYQYRFRMKAMDKIKRNGGNQHLHRKSKSYRKKVEGKIGAYHRYIQTAMIAQGMLQLLSATACDSVRTHFRTWLRTVRPGVLPTEFACSTALRNSLPDFLAGRLKNAILQKFINDRIDPLTARNERRAA